MSIRQQYIEDPKTLKKRNKGTRSKKQVSNNNTIRRYYGPANKSATPKQPLT